MATFTLPYNDERERQTLQSLIRHAKSNYHDYVLAEILRSMGGNVAFLWDLKRVKLAGMQYSAYWTTLENPNIVACFTRFDIEKQERAIVRKFIEGIGATATISDMLQVLFYSAGIEPLEGETERTIQHGRDMIPYVLKVRMAHIQRAIQHEAS